MICLEDVVSHKPFYGQLHCKMPAEAFLQTPNFNKTKRGRTSYIPCTSLHNLWLSAALKIDGNVPLGPRAFLNILAIDAFIHPLDRC